MTTWIVLLVAVIASVIAAPHEDIANNRLPLVEEESLPVSSRISIETSNISSRTRSTRRNGETRETHAKEPKSVLLSILNQISQQKDSQDSVESENRQTHNKKIGKKSKKRKSVYNYAPLPHYQNSHSHKSGYNGNSYSETEQKAQDSAKKHHESDIFYVKLPPTPYAFVPGIGYISQPPKYATANLLSHSSNGRPIKQQMNRRRPSKPFIELPIDFVSNGKPTSVYKWQKKRNKVPTDSPITNLDDLSNDFISNGKPTSIHRWESNQLPTKRPDDVNPVTSSENLVDPTDYANHPKQTFTHQGPKKQENLPDDYVNWLDKGPYYFNFHPARVFILHSDDSQSHHSPIFPPDYQSHIQRYKV